MPGSPKNEPFRNCNFVVEIDGIPSAGFAECSGLTSEVDIVEYREGNEDVVRKLPGLRKFGNITLKRGVTGSMDIYEWHRQLLKGQAQRRNGTIILLDDEKNQVARWSFREGLPQKYEGPRLNAKTSEVAIETLVICCEGLEREVI